MTSDRHLALMALMRELDEPTKTFNRSVRVAGALGSNTPGWEDAVEKGNAALDVIERAVRAWVAAHPEPVAVPSKDTPLPEYDFIELVAFASKVESEGFGYAFEEYPPHFEAPDLAPIAAEYSLLRQLLKEWQEAVHEFWTRPDAEAAYDAHIDEARRRRREQRSAAGSV
ncbi:hypothetical protein ACIGMX_34780 [Streptomyces aquilus]|uniref:hypothetical protein n=1 Tax=Streptomyces aquilus TaxID=2548456 RepID=UPI0037D79B62